MVSFLSKEMDGILRWLKGFFIRKEVLKAADTSYKLSKLQVLDQNNWRMKSNVKLNTNGTETLKNLKSTRFKGFLCLLVERHD